ncbi:hypothetical protein ACEQ8H_007019 [Pleosporales sp. CAS-2024a]
MQSSPAPGHATALQANTEDQFDFLNGLIGAHQDSDDQHTVPDPSFPLLRSDLSIRQTSESAAPFIPSSSHRALRGVAEYVAASSPGTQRREVTGVRPAVFHTTSSPHSTLKMQNPPVGVARHYRSSPQAPTDDITPLYESSTERQSRYQPFQHRFATAQEARDYRRHGTRFGRVPYLECDPTIVAVENNRNLHVEQIYNALTSGEHARDNANSIAMKRWVINAHYPQGLVEAYAHKLFDCLLQQARQGFRGWEHNDYVADERKGEDVDREVDCAQRLTNIIESLEQEKTICEDIMTSACQIRMFVNAPRAYANRKQQNRQGNSKRGRGKEAPDANSRAAKVQKTCSRRTRARSSAAPEPPSSRGSTPQRQQPPQQHVTAGPYYASPASQQFLLSPTSSSYMSHRTAPVFHRPSMSPHACLVASSPHTSSPYPPQVQQPHMLRVATAPPYQSSSMGMHDVFLPMGTSAAAVTSPSLTTRDSQHNMFHFGAEEPAAAKPNGHSCDEAVDVDPQQLIWSLSSDFETSHMGGGNGNGNASLFAAQTFQDFVNPADVEFQQPGGGGGDMAHGHGLKEEHSTHL